MKKKLLASLTLYAIAFCAISAPIPSYRVATNIADTVSRTVVSNTVTRSYIEGLVSGSGGLVNATNIINDITRDSTQATLINRTDGQEDNAIVTIGSVDKQSNLAGLMTVEDKETLDSIVHNLASKANKSAPSAAGNLAALTADGDIEDSGKTADDFLPRVSNGPVDSTFDLYSPLLMNMNGYIQLEKAGFIYGPFDNILEEMGSKISLRTELDSKADRSMISATDPTFSNEVATVARTVTPPPSPTLRLYDEVRQCYWIGRMVNGVINWEVE